MAEKKSLMKVSRAQKGNGVSVWTIDFEEKLLAKIAKENGGLTYNPQESFELNMRVKNGAEGAIKNNETGKSITYKVAVEVSEEKGRAQITYDCSDGMDYSYLLGLNRGYTTMSFYRFFNDVIRKSNALVSVQRELEKPAEEKDTAAPETLVVTEIDDEKTGPMVAENVDTAAEENTVADPDDITDEPSIEESEEPEEVDPIQAAMDEMED